MQKELKDSLSQEDTTYTFLETTQSLGHQVLWIDALAKGHLSNEDKIICQKGCICLLEPDYCTDICRKYKIIVHLAQ